MSKEIYLSPKARAVAIKSGEFEIYHILTNRKGQILEPADEDFGVWAWCCYTIDRALQIVDQIENGLRPIISMNRQV